MDHVFSIEPPIVIVEVEDDEAEVPFYHIYLEGVNVGSAASAAEARDIASEVFASVTGEPLEEGDFNE